MTYSQNILMYGMEDPVILWEPHHINSQRQGMCFFLQKYVSMYVNI
jgi:hypothetical protein